MKNAPIRQNSIIIRPHAAPAVLLVQLDDIYASALEHVKSLAFLTPSTSSGNHQAWIAMEDGTAEFARRLRKGSYADLSASGAARLAGTMNFKRKYAPEFPKVSMIDAYPGRIVMKSPAGVGGILHRKRFQCIPKCERIRA